MQTTSSKNSALWARRLGLIAFLVAVLVFGTEAVLSGMRVRNIEVSFKTSGSTAPATPDPLATPASDQGAAKGTPVPTTNPALLFVKPNDPVMVKVQWDYRIGPRFQKTTVRASALIEDRKIAEASIVIDCGTAVISCTGSDSISLSYTIPDTGKGPQTVPWPAGDYTLLVERSFGGLQFSSLKQANFRVENP